MAYTVQFRRGTTAEHSTFTGEKGEVTFDTTTNRLVVHDGTTVSGIVIAKLSDIPTDLAQLTDTTSLVTEAWQAKLAKTNKDYKTLYMPSVRNMSLNTDGTKVYVVDNRYVYEYDLSIANDLSTAVLQGSYYYYTPLTNDESHMVEISGNGAHLYLASTSSGIIYQFDLATPYDITTISNPSKSINLVSEENKTLSMEMNSTGTKMWTTGGTTDEVHQYTLSTPYDITTVVYDDVQFNLNTAAGITTAQSIVISTDGSKMYVFDSSFDELFEFDLSSAYDISTATYNGISTWINGASHATMSPDGSKLYASEGSVVVQYSLTANTDDVVAPTPSSTTWELDMSSLVPDSRTLLVSNCRQIAVSDDGTKAYVATNRYIREYNLSTPYDLSSSVYVNEFYYYGAIANDETSFIEISSNGEHLYLTNDPHDQIEQLTMTTPYDITTAGSRKTINISHLEIQPTGISFSSDGQKFIMVGISQDRVYEFVCTTPWDISTSYWTGARTYVGLQGTNPRSCAYSSDGTKMYVFQYNGTLFEYALSTPYAVATANINNPVETTTFGRTIDSVTISKNGKYIYGSYSNVIYQYKIDGTSSNPVASTPSSTTWDFTETDFTFDEKTFNSANYGNSRLSIDGTKWFTNNEQRYVTEHTLSTPFDISTATVVRSYYFYSQTGYSLANSLEFTADGTKFYIAAHNGYVYQFTCASAYDLTSVTQTGYFYIDLQVDVPRDLVLSYDGKKMFITGSTNDKIVEYVLSTPFDITTAYWTGNEIYVGSQDANPHTLEISSDGLTLYMHGHSAITKLHKYTMTTAYDLGTATYSGAISIPSIYWPSFSHDGKWMYGTNTANTAFVNQYRVDGSTVTAIVSTPSSTTWDFTETNFAFDKKTFNAANYGNSRLSIDGTKWFTLNDQRYVTEHTLSTPFDLSTATVVRSYFFYSEAGSSLANSLEFASDGTKFYIAAHNDYVYEFTCASAYDLASVTKTGYVSIGSHFTEPRDLVLSYDGKKMFVVGTGNDKIVEYVLSTPFDVTTAYWGGNEIYVGSQDANPYTLEISSDGLTLYMHGHSVRTNLHKYTMTTANDLETATYSGAILIPATYWITFSHDGKWMYGTNNTNTAFVNQYRVDGSTVTAVVSTPSSTTWDFTETNFAFDEKTFNAANYGNSRMSLDGTKWFTLNDQRYVTEHTLSTLFDISTATVVRSYFFYGQAGSSLANSLEFTADGTKFYIAAHNDYVYEFTLATPYDLTSVTKTGYVSIGSHFTEPRDLVLSYDGKKMFVVGTGNDKIVEYVLATPFDVTTAYWAGDEIYVGSQDANPYTLEISSDGLTLYMHGHSVRTNLHKYTMTTANDLGTATYVGAISIPAIYWPSFSHDGKWMYGTNNTNTAFVNQYRVDGSTVTAVVSTPSSTTWDFTETDFAFDEKTFNGASYGNSRLSIDGTKWFTIRDQRYVVEHTLSTPFDLSTATYTREYYFYSQTGSSLANSLEFTADGTKFYITPHNDYVYEFTCASAYDLASVTHTGYVSIGSHFTEPRDLVLSYDGKKMFVVGTGNDKIVEYVLSTPFDVTTAYWAGNEIYVGSEDATPYTLEISSDGLTLYMHGHSTRTNLHKYTMTTANDLGTATYSGAISIPATYYPSFSHDGKWMYGTNNTNHAFVNQYRVDGSTVTAVVSTPSSTTWEFDETTVPFNEQKTLTIGTPINTRISMDGTKLFAIRNYRYVVEHTLSTPFDLSTATYTREYYFLGTTGNQIADSIEFASDGTKFYIAAGNDYVYQWTLATPYDLTSVTQAGYVYIGSNLTAPRDLVLSYDGKKMFVVGSTNDKIIEYVLTTPFDVTTAYWTGNEIYVGSQDANPYTLEISSDGLTLYMHGHSVRTNLHKYTMTTANDLGTATYSGAITISATYYPSFSHDGKYMYGRSPTDSTLIEQFRSDGTLSAPGSVANIDFYVAPWVSASLSTSANNFYVNNTETLMVATDGSTLRSFTLGSDANLGKMQASTTFSAGSGVTSVALSDEESIAESADWSNSTLAYTLDNPNAYGTSQDDYFANVAISSTHAIIGAQNEGVGAEGKAYIFDLSDGSLAYTLDNPNQGTGSETGDLYGVAVGISDTHAIVGAYGEDDSNGLNSGIAYIFDLSDGSLAHTINNPNAYGTATSNGYSNDQFGNSVAISGDYAIVGASYEDDANGVGSAFSGNDSGKAYIFKVSDGSLLHTLDNPDAYGDGVQDYFGTAVSISGDYAIVSARVEDDAGGNNSGKAYIFNVTSGSLVYTLDNPNGYGTSESDYFGGSVAISDTHAIVGAYNEDDAGGINSGKAYIFDLSDGSLAYTLHNPNQHGTSGDDGFGWSVSISDTHVAVGSWGESDANGSNSGKVYIYDLSDGSLTNTLDNPNAYDTSEGDRFGTTVSISGSNIIVGAMFEDDAGGTSSGKSYIFSVPSPVASASGEEMYVLKTGSNTITQYTLSTPGDISTATSTSTFTCPAGIIDFAFSSDGTRVYMMNSTEIQQFDLSTPWAITSASLATNGTFDISNEITTPLSLQLTSSAGTLNSKFNVYGTNSSGQDELHQYTMGTPNDITTTSYSNDFGIDNLPAPSNTNAFVSQAGDNIIFRRVDDTYRTYYFNVNNIPSFNFQSPAVNSSLDITTSLVSMNKILDISGFHGFVDDGNKFVTTSGSTTTVHDVSTPYDITSATPGATASADYGLSPYYPGLENVKFSADGTKLYLRYNYYNSGNDYKIREITCNSPFNPNGTIVGTYNLGAAIYDFDLSYDGTALYVLYTGGAIYQYGLATPGSIASRYDTGITFNVIPLDSNPRTIQLSDDGTKMFVFGTTDDRVHQLDMTTAFDLSTATYNGVKTDAIVSAVAAYITNDGSRLNARMGGVNQVVAYSINGDLATPVTPTPGTAWAGDITTSLVSMKKTLDYPIGSSEGFQGFVDSGNKFVTVSGDTTTVHDVSTPYDITTGTPSTSAAHGLSPYYPGLERAQFSADGTKLYLRYNYYNSGNDHKIREITCNSPFNPNGTIVGTYSGEAQSIYGGVYDMCTSYDMKKMYILNHSKIIYEYVMQTPGSIASMYWTGVSFNANTLDSNPRTLHISDDGTKMFVFGTTDDRVHQVDITTAFDLSTATYNGVKTDAIVNAGVAYITDDCSRLNAQISGTSRVVAYSINGDLATPVTPTPGTAWAGDITTSLVSMKKTLDYSMGTSEGFQGFVDDGNKFVTVSGDTTTVHDVSTPYDITTGTPGTSAAHGLSPYYPGLERAQFSADGTKLYLRYNYYNSGNDHKIREITCNSPFNPNGTIVGTYSGENQSIYGGVYDMCTSYDMKKMYILNHSKIIYEYVMVTPGSIASIYWTGESFDANALDSNPRTLHISDDGTKMFVFGTTDDRVHQIDMTTAFDLSTATYNGVKTDAIVNAGVAYISDDGSRLNAQISGTSRVEAYSINGDLATPVTPTPGTAWAGDITASLVSSIKSYSTSMTGGCFYGFVDDGNKFVTTSGDTTTVHDVSTPYDVSTRTTATSAAHGLSPYYPSIESAKFSADGTKLYLRYNYYNSGNDHKIREITCNSPFNPNGTIVGTYSGATQSIYGGVYDMCTSYDMKKMYILNHSKIIYEYIMVTPGSIASMYWTGESFDATTLDSNPRTIQLSDDGTKMFVFGTTDDKVHQLDMTTAFDLSTATYNGVKTSSFPFYENDINGMWISSDGNTISGRIDSATIGVFYIDGTTASLPTVTTPVGYDASWNFDFDSIVDDKKVHSSLYHTKFVSNDGTKLYQINSTSKIVYQYELSIAHDISSAISGTYGQSSVTLSNLTDYLYNVFVSPDGTNLYAIDFDNKLYHYTMSTPHNLSTAVYTAVNSGVSSLTQLRNIEFNPDGSGFNLYYATSGGIVKQYICATPWDITTAYWTANQHVFGTSNIPHSFQINADGTKAYTFMREDDTLREYTMSTPWDISTISSTPSNTHIYSGAWEVFISPNGSRVMVSTDINYGNIYRTDGSYHTPVTSSGGSITWAGDITSLVDANKSFNTGYSNGWTLSDDGTKLYTMNGQRVDEHTLSTAHDISSASFDQAVQLGQAPLSGITGFVNRIHINSAGTKMFVLNTQNPREIYQYDFGTPFDVATLTKSTSPRSDSYFKDIIGETNITDFTMSYDGKKLFHTRGDRIVERVLATAFDITTEYKTGNEYWTGDIDSSPQMLQFSSDGLKLYMFGANTDSMYEFTMTTAYDISTMAYNGTTKRVRSVSLGNLSSDGTKMYVLIGTTLHQYDNS